MKNSIKYFILFAIFIAINGSDCSSEPDPPAYSAIHKISVVPHLSNWNPSEREPTGYTPKILSFNQDIVFEARSNDGENKLLDKWGGQVIVVSSDVATFTDVFGCLTDGDCTAGCGRVNGKQYPGMRKVMLFDAVSDGDGKLKINIGSSRRDAPGGGFYPRYDKNMQLKAVSILIKSNKGKGKYIYGGVKWGSATVTIDPDNPPRTIGYVSIPAEEAKERWEHYKAKYDKEPPPQQQNKFSNNTTCSSCEIYIDSDNDMTSDCDDNCPNDQGKIDPGICGCAVSDIDSDFDGVPDCNDACPENIFSTELPCRAFGDADLDGDVDMDDFGEYQRCYGKSKIDYEVWGTCFKWDYNQDGHIGHWRDEYIYYEDGDSVRVFECMSRSNVPGPCLP